MTYDKVIFVRGLSRSGGTLMNTILDSHPDVAMTYETYEHLLAPEEGIQVDVDSLLQACKKQSWLSFAESKLFPLPKGKANFKKFVGRAERAGITPENLTGLFKEHFRAGLGLVTFKERMRFVERLSVEKMRIEGKRYWGAKIGSIYEELHEMYSKAYFLFMLRDGRDIAASRIKMGDFKQGIEGTALGWCRQIKKFEKFASKTAGRAFLVPYEKLVQSPETELRLLMDKLGLPWSDQLLSFYKLNLSIHRNPTGHLSGEQLKNPINTSSIGRWKKDLTDDEIRRFQEIAGLTLEKYKYL